ncbi:hypothetical protein [Schlesneria sp. T3-172]|uniref:hypothetical protein n=1 Tax=Schlesneria sphaerica TaxID=3373610 RepID=UPI0037CADA13
MSFRISRWATGGLALVAVLVMAGLGWSHFYDLGPSKDEWGLKYEAEVVPQGDVLNVSFTLADQGRLKPIYSVSVVAFSDPRPGGGRAYLLNATIDLKPTADGKLAGTLQVDKKFADRALLRIMTLTFDGKPQRDGARYYQMPLKQFTKKTPALAIGPKPTALAAPIPSKVAR